MQTELAFPARRLPLKGCRLYVAAYMWYLPGGSAGETRSTVAKADLALSMTEAEKSSANTRAAEWLRSISDYVP
jgi:hypothetical protein